MGGSQGKCWELYVPTPSPILRSPYTASPGSYDRAGLTQMQAWKSWLWGIPVHSPHYSFLTKWQNSYRQAAERSHTPRNPALDEGTPQPRHKGSWEDTMSPFFFVFFVFFLDFIYLFLERGKEGRKRGGETLIYERYIDWLLLPAPQLGSCPVTQACALTGKRTVTSQFAGRRSIRGATPARARVSVTILRRWKTGILLVAQRLA